jgi:putative transposase
MPKQITKQLRRIYQAPTVAAAEVAFEEFAEEWRPTYPAMIRS